MRPVSKFTTYARVFPNASAISACVLPLFFLKSLMFSAILVVHKNSLTSDESSYARVERHTVDIEHIVASSDERDTGVSKYTLLHCAYLIKDLVFENISQGNAVNVLDLGTLYLKSSGSIHSENPVVADIPEISVAFTPSKEACEAASKVKVAGTVNAVT